MGKWRRKVGWLDNKDLINKKISKVKPNKRIVSKSSAYALSCETASSIEVRFNFRFFRHSREKPLEAALRALLSFGPGDKSSRKRDDRGISKKDRTDCKRFL